MRTATLRSACILPALALAATAVPAHAQVAASYYRSMTKTEAILGGKPSALAAITSAQGGRPLYSSYVTPAAGNSNFRNAVANYVRPAVSSDRPDVFNSVALSIGRSPLDARWSHVSGAGVGGNAGAIEQCACLRILRRIENLIGVAVPGKEAFDAREIGVSGCPDQRRSGLPLIDETDPA